jgi:hypothetical protein
MKVVSDTATLEHQQKEMAEAVVEGAKRGFFCGPEGELAFKNGFIYSPSGRVVGSYAEPRHKRAYFLHSGSSLSFATALNMPLCRFVAASIAGLLTGLVDWIVLIAIAIFTISITALGAAAIRANNKRMDTIRAEYCNNERQHTPVTR